MTPERNSPQIVGRFATRQQHKRNRGRPKPGKVKPVQATTGCKGQEVYPGRSGSVEFWD